MGDMKHRHHKSGRCLVVSSHSTVIPEANVVIQFLESAECKAMIERIVLGELQVRIGNGPRRLKVVAIHGGMKITVRGAGSRQELFVYCLDAPVVVSALKTWNWIAKNNVSIEDRLSDQTS